MTQKTLRIKATPDKNVTGYWVSVDATDVTLENGEGTVTFDAGETAVLVWWISGSSGAALALVAKDLEDQVLVESKSTIPKNETVHAGFKRFNPRQPK